MVVVVNRHHEWQAPVAPGCRERDDVWLATRSTAKSTDAAEFVADVALGGFLFWGASQVPVGVDG